jgi:hypothetical protein
LAHLTAELYGREDATLLAWQRTCTQVSDALRPQHAGDRLTKALALAQDGSVELASDDRALVHSGDQRYAVLADGTCACPDYVHRGMPCKHALAVLIHTQALALLEPAGAVPAPSTPAAAAPPRRGRPSRLPALATPPPAPTSATWNVQEAPTSACFKWRMGTAELLYTFRGVDDGEVLQRIATQLPLLQELVDGYEARAEAQACARAAERAAAQAAAQAPPTVHELVQQAVQQALAARSGQATNGQAASRDAGPPQCPEHGAMRESTKAPGTWYCTQKLANGAFCKAKA